MFTQTRSLLLGCVLLALAGCSSSSSDSDDNSNPPVGPESESPIMESAPEAERASALASADLVLSVTDTSGAPLADVIVSDASGEIGVTDSAGNCVCWRCRPAKKPSVLPKLDMPLRSGRMTFSTRRLSLSC